MRYFAMYNENNVLVSIGTGNGGTEITEAKYNELLSMIRKKAAFVNAFYNGEITISEVPADWQEEIQRRVDERRAWEEANAEAEALEEDYQNELRRLGVEV